MKIRNFARKIRRAQAFWAKWLAIVAMGATFQFGANSAQAVSQATINMQPEQVRGRDNSYYNVQLPEQNLRMAFNASFAVGYDDNINNSSGGSSGGNRQRSAYVQPGVGMSLRWTPSPYFKINSSVGVTYTDYFNSHVDDTWGITGDGGGLGTSVEAELKLGQTGKLTLGDSIYQTLDNMNVSNQNNNTKGYKRTENNTWLQYAGDLNDSLHATTRYDHTITWVTPSDYKYESYQADTFDTVLLQDLRKNLAVGPYATVTKRYYQFGQPQPDGTDIKRNDSMMYALGGAFVTTINSKIYLNGRVGYEWLDFNSNNDIAKDQGRTPTYELQLYHRITERTTQSLNSSYGLSEDYRNVGVNFAREWSNGYVIYHDLTENWMVNADVTFRRVDESDNGETYDMIQFGVGASYKISQHATLSCRYQHTRKLHGTNNDDYGRNIVSTTLNYRF